MFYIASELFVLIDLALLIMLENRVFKMKLVPSHQF